MIRMKRESFLTFLLISLGIIPGGVLAPHSAQAQTCEIIRDEIITLRPPSFGQYTVWDYVQGEKGMEQIADFVPLEEGGFVAAGSYTAGEEDRVYKPYLFSMDGRGKLLWETREASPVFKTIERILKVGDKYVVTGDIKDPKKGDGIYMAFYSLEGKRLKQFPVFEPQGDLDAKAIVRAQDGNGYFIAAQYTPSGKTEGGYGIVYKLSNGGSRLLRRAYTPGMDTTFTNMQPAKDGSYFITGSVRSENGKRAGWLVKIDDRASITWAQTYPRGKSAILRSVMEYPNGDYFMTGESVPLSGRHPSGWVARTDSGGNVLWQRYFYGSYSYGVWDALTYPDGRAVALLRGVPQKLVQRGHVRLLTFTPEGVLINSEDFSDFNGATAFRLQAGPDGERIFAGYSQTSMDDALVPGDISPRTYDAWITAAQGLEVYDDPCLPEVNYR